MKYNPLSVYTKTPCKDGLGHSLFFHSKIEAFNDRAKLCNRRSIEKTFDKRGTLYMYTFPIIVPVHNFLLRLSFLPKHWTRYSKSICTHTHKKRNPGLDYRSDGGSRVCYFHRWLFFVASKLIRRRFLGERGFTTGDTRVDHSLSFSAPSPFCQPCS